MRKYEMVVILDPSVDERTVTGTFEKLVQVIPTEGGTIDNVDIWGKRKFAYEIDKKTEGIYIVLSFTAKASTAPGAGSSARARRVRHAHQGHASRR